jgi:hypothetical protein
MKSYAFKRYSDQPPPSRVMRIRLSVMRMRLSGMRTRYLVVPPRELLMRMKLSGMRV